MSFDGHASTSAWSIRPRGEGIGSIGCAVRTPSSSLTGHYAMATAEHREPCDSRGSCTVLGAPGGETPLGDSTKREAQSTLWTRLNFPRNLPTYRSATIADGQRANFRHLILSG